MTDRYEIVSQLGHDQLGSVYLADDTMLQRRVMFRHIEHGDNVEAEERGDAWRKEFATFAGKLSTMQHPHMLTIYDISVEKSGAFVVTQYVKGDSLAERLSEGPLGQIGVFRLAADMLEALHAAHKSDVYHGALHTSSIMRVHRAAGGHRYLLVDLGLNQLVSMVKDEKVKVADPVLMAPELHDNDHEPDAKADLFMLGQLCYTALAGGHPLSGKSIEECIETYRTEGMPPLEDYVDDIQPEFSAWVMSLLEYDPEKRPADTGEAMVALHTITINEPEPNVPGKTHAVALEDLPRTRETTGPVSATPETAPVSVAPTQRTAPVAGELTAVQIAAANSAARSQQQHAAPGPLLGQPTGVANTLAVPQKDKKKGLMVGILSAVAVILIIGLVIGLRGRGGNRDAGAKPSEEVVSTEHAIRIGDTEIINTFAKQDSPVILDLDGSNVVDWLVVTGVPSPSKVTDKVDGLYIQSLQTVDVKAEYRLAKSPIRFKSGGRELIPRASTGKGMGSKPGAGYELLLRIPAKQDKSATVNLYVMQKFCILRVEVTDPRGDSIEVKEIPYTEQGVVHIPVEIDNPKPGDFYTIKVVSASSGDQGAFSIGLNGVKVETR
ncbi:hypothetical protein NT6N_29790 [Oceaniferula spumae]|uniref:Protein kinase domain-containing protein n=1 Tax=Oceaniferula spumae TaxID=2979115 RepID=A0AAT9FPW9_9BACT